MPDRLVLTRRTLLVVGAGALGACRRKTELVVFCASSLTRAFGDLADALKADHPGLEVRIEPSGSQVAARKVSELGMRADIVASADLAVLDRLLVPDFAPAAAGFATNELVLAHRDHSRFTDEVTAANWPEVLLRPGVRLGRVDPDLAPLGYHTLVAWKLYDLAAARAGAPEPVEPRLRAACAKEHVTSDEAELVALLEARAIDYAFVYRSTAEDHRLKITSLPPELNLSQKELAPAYATVSVDVSMKQGAKVSVRGSPMVYGLAIPRDAPNPALARAFAWLVASDRGRRILEHAGFRPLVPAPGLGALEEAPR